MRTIIMSKPNYSVVYLLFLLPAITGFLFGYGITAASGALGPKFNQAGHPQLIQVLNLDNFQQGTFTSISLVGALFGSMIVFKIGDIIGRKGALFVSAFWYIVGSIFIIFTPIHLSGAIYFLFAGQFLYGLGVGFGMHSAPLYIAEIAPAEIRGFLVAMKEQVIVLGILFGYLIGYLVQNSDDGWRYVFVPPVAISVCTILGLLKAPESPRLVLLRATSKRLVSSEEELPLFDNSLDYEKARNILRVLRKGESPEAIDNELVQMNDSLQASMQNQVSYKDLFTGATYKALKIGIALVFFQQITGQPSVLAYAPQIFRSAGFGDDALLPSIYIGVAKLFATGFAVFTSDKFGRKPLLLAGTFGMLIALVMLMTSFWVSVVPDGSYAFNDAWKYVTLCGLILYVSSYQVGYGPMVWLLQSEIFPLNARSRAQSIAVWTNFLTNCIISWTYLPFLNLVTVHGSYGIYAVLCVVSNFYVYFYVPETKGKTLEQIQEVFFNLSEKSKSKETGDVNASS